MYRCRKSTRGSKSEGPEMRVKVLCRARKSSLWNGKPAFGTLSLYLALSLLERRKRMEWQKVATVSLLKPEICQLRMVTSGTTFRHSHAR